MTNQDWHVTQESQCIVPSQELLVEEPIVPYRLYRFLTDLEEILLKDSNNTILPKTTTTHIHDLFKNGTGSINNNNIHLPVPPLLL